ncbi:MAG: PD-(D/E)XK nuclease superfamily protein, partial [Cyanobacteria bacterium P01_H01_bin.121]
MSLQIPYQAGAGYQANQSGETAETLVACLLESLGFAVRRQQIYGRNIYGGELRVDIFLPEIELVIEVKWQDRRGSTDEKFPYLVENLRRLPCRSVVVHGGGGARNGAIEWLAAQVDHEKLIA